MKKIGNEEYTTWEDIESELGISEEEMAEINLKVQLVEKIIEARESKGITQAKLAEITGLKQAAISRLETSKAIPRLDTILKLLTPLGYKLAIVKSDSNK